MFQYCYDTEIGKLFIAEKNEFITNVSFFELNVQYKETPVIKKTHLQLTEYFRGQRKSFDIPIAPEGTDFQHKVWNALSKIPYGKTATYKDIATLIGNPKACRAVGMANNKNPIAIIIPCHRVIGTNGNLTGYAAGLGTKQKLLEIEKNI